MSFNPIHRVTGYVRRSLDPNEATVLTPTSGAPHAKPFRMATKAHGFALDFGGNITQYLIRDPVGAWPTVNLTLECWARRTADAQVYRGFLSYARQTVQFNEIQWAVDNSNGTVSLAINGTAVNTSSGAMPADGKYHHIMATWQSSGGNWAIYVDGVSKATGTALQSSYSIVAGGVFVVGQEQDSAGGTFDALQAWLGQIDELRVYTRVLSPTEVLDHFAGRYIDETGLVGRWGFDDPALIGRDHSSSANHLTPFGFSDQVGMTTDTILHFEPYLFLANGRRGAMDLLSKRIGVGSMSATFQDQRVTAGGVNSDRFLTAFFGDGKGANRMAGTKLFFEESLDDGLTWVPLFTGRIQTNKLIGKLKYDVSVRDLTEDLKRMKLFVTSPHPSATNASVGSLLPVGFIKAYGVQTVTPPMRGTLAVNRTVQYQNNSYVMTFIILDNASVPRQDNVWTQNLLDLMRPIDEGSPDNNPVFRLANGAKAHITINGGAQNGQQGDVRVGLLGANRLFGNGIHHILSLSIMSLDTTEVGYVAIPSDATSVDFYVYGENEISSKNPLLINDSALGTVWQNVLDGYYAERWTWLERHSLPAGVALGTPKYKIPYDAAAFATVVADARVPVLRFLETDPTDALDWLQKKIFPLGFSYRFDGWGRLIPVDLRMPVTADLVGIPTIVDADLQEGEDSAEWEQERSESLSRARYYTYIDTPIAITALQPRGDPRAPNSLPILEYAMLQPTAIESVEPGLGSLDVGDQEERIEYWGLRSMTDEKIDGRLRADWAREKGRTVVQHLKRPYGNGAQPAVLKCRRTSHTNLFQGELVIVQVSWLPDPVTFRRGGARLMRVVDRVETGDVGRTLHLLDLGLSGISSAPTLGAPAQQTGNRLHGAKTAVMRNAASDDVEVWVAITDTSVGIAPIEASSLWSLIDVVRANRDATYNFIPAGKRAWFRGRSVPTGDNESPLIPSGFTPATAPGYVDTVVLTPPSSPTEISKSARALRAGFTPNPSIVDGTSYFHGTEVRLASPTSDPLASFRVLEIGASYIDVLGCDPSTQYRVGFRHVDGMGGVSSEITVDITTTATALVAPAMRAISVVAGTP